MDPWKKGHRPAKTLSNAVFPEPFGPKMTQFIPTLILRDILLSKFSPFGIIIGTS